MCDLFGSWVWAPQKSLESKTNKIPDNTSPERQIPSDLTCMRDLKRGRWAWAEERGVSIKGYKILITLGKAISRFTVQHGDYA